MSMNNGFENKDNITAGIERGLYRARRDAWNIARQTKTAFITCENGRVIRRYPAEGEEWPGVITGPGIAADSLKVE